MENSVKNRTHASSPPTSMGDMSPTGKGGARNRSRESSGGQGSAHQQNTVKEAVAIAAGKKGVGQSEEDEGKSAVKSNMLCYLYWLLVVLIMGLISFTVWLSIKLARRHSNALLAQGGLDGRTQPFSFDDVFDEKFKPRTFDVEWFDTVHEDNGEAFTYRAKDGSLMAYYLQTNTTEVLMEKSIFDELNTNRYYVSHDLNFVLLEYDVKRSRFACYHSASMKGPADYNTNILTSNKYKVLQTCTNKLTECKWRHSVEARYKIYDRRVRPGKAPLVDFPANMELRSDRLQNVRWAPTTTALVFIYKNDIYYQKNPREFAVRVTNTGDGVRMFNGIADWLYEEEILMSSVAIWWSPDSQYFCYASFNDSKVPIFRYSAYGHNQEITELAFPRAFQDSDSPANWNTLPRVTLHLFNTDNVDGRPVQIPAPEDLSRQHYLTQVMWKDKSHVAVTWSNREQNKTVTRISSVDGRFSYNNIYQTSTKGWITTCQSMLFIGNQKDRLVTMWPHVQEEEYCNTLTIMTIKEGEDIGKSFISSCYNEVKSIAGYDYEKNFIYYLATNGDPKQQHLFRVFANASRSGQNASECLTCNISSDCNYVSASFSKSGKFYILGCLGPAIPTYRLRSTDGTMDTLLEENAEIRQLLENKILPKKEFIEIPIGGKYKAWAEVIRPNVDDDDDNLKKYPLLVQANDEPGGQLVTEKFELGWKTYLASTEEAVHVTVDVRGTASRGLRYRNEVHRTIGTTDVDDQLLAGVFLKQLKFIDPAKAAIWGWSYGGSVASHAVANETDVYPCGIAGSALADLYYYNSAKYERLLGLSDPGDNREGYEKTDILKKVKHFDKKKYLLIHGTADDNVAYAGSARLVRALTDADFQFRFQLYTDLGSYYMPDDRHIYKLMTDFLKNECYSYFWKHDTKTWLVDRAVKKERFRIKQFCV